MNVCPEVRPPVGKPLAGTAVIVVTVPCAAVAAVSPVVPPTVYVQLVIGFDREAPDRVIEVIVAAEPGLLKAKVRSPFDAVRVTDDSVIVFTFEPKRPNVYAPTTNASTSVTAMSMIVAMTGVIAFLLFFSLRLILFMIQPVFDIIISIRKDRF